MALHYYCRHCNTKLGTILERTLNASKLGFDALSHDERQEMISYDTAGDIHVRAICEDCHESLDKNPSLHQHDFIIH
jgi:hypothetical protein